MSEGETPLILDAWAMVTGPIAFSFCRASIVIGINIRVVKVFRNYNIFQPLKLICVFLLWQYNRNILLELRLVQALLYSIRFPPQMRNWF